MKKEKTTYKAKEAKVQTIKEQKECLMPLRIAMASGKMPAIGTNKKKEK